MNENEAKVAIAESKMKAVVKCVAWISISFATAVAVYFNPNDGYSVGIAGVIGASYITKMW